MQLRKTVTVLFSDIADSTSLGETLDAEVVGRVLQRYFGEVRDVLERHGGRVEKFIGDAVLAVFGVPVAREDDALRAMRAAAEIRERLELLNDELERDLGIRLGVRTGISTGELLVTEGGGEGFTFSGDTMNVAARLEQTAAPGEIVIAETTRVLGGDAIAVEELEPLALKGKARPVAAFRLDRVLPGISPYTRRDDAPLVGRAEELAALRDALRRATKSADCVLVTVVGLPGVGKSRLVREFLSGLDDTARVLAGRCAPYGEGITYLPLAEALEPVLGADPRGAVLGLLAGDERAGVVASSVAGAFGADDDGTSGEETSWAFRRLLEALARELPLVLVVDDIHWAEATLLDVLEDIASFSSGVPLLLVCMSRPELLEERPSWAAPRETATVVPLAPLAQSEAAALVDELLRDRELAEEDVRRIVEAAGGNPLFLEQLLALNTGLEGTGELVVPPTIQALLAARIDRLDAEERAALRCAAVEGREFDRGAVTELAAPEDRAGVGGVLLSLARRQLIRAEHGDTMSFVHGLAREAAYAETPKEVRADLHARLAEYVEREGLSPAEIVGHHLAEAARYRSELGFRDEATRELAERAADRLAAAGRRALARGDDRDAAKLLERACALGSAEDAAALAVRAELGRALAGAGALDRARSVFADLRAAAERAGERALELRGELGLLGVRAQTEATFSMSELVDAAERAVPVFEAERDEWGLARSWFLIHWARFRTGRLQVSVEAAERVVEHAHRAGDSRESSRALGAIAMASLWGPTPVAEALERCDELVERAEGARLVEAFTLRVRGGLCSMTGAFDEGREHCRRSVEIYEELGHPISAVGVASELQRVERKAGNLDVAERELRRAWERLTELGDAAYVSWVVAQLAVVLAEQGESADAIELARLVREQMQQDHAFAQIGARRAEAVALLAQEQRDEARAVAHEAQALVEQTDMLDLHADVLLVLADLEPSAAHVHRTRAVELYERKGDSVSAARARTLAHAHR